MNNKIIRFMVGDRVRITDRWNIGLNYSGVRNHGEIGHEYFITSCKQGNGTGGFLVNAVDDEGNVLKQVASAWFDLVLGVLDNIATLEKKVESLQGERTRLATKVTEGHKTIGELLDANTRLDGARIEAQRLKLENMDRCIEAERDRDAYSAAFTYMLELVSKKQAQRALGYLDGVR